MLEALLESSRATKRTVCLLYDTVAITLALYIAMSLRLGTLEPPVTYREFTTLGVTLFFSLAVFIRVGLYRAILRYMTLPTSLSIAGGALASAVILSMSSFMTSAFVPRSVPVIYFITLLLMIGVPRLLVRNVIHLLNHYSEASQSKMPVIVYGAGYTAHQLKLALTSTTYKIVAFVDDNQSLHGTMLGNIKVHSPTDIGLLAKTHGARKVFLALGSTPHSRRAEIIRQLEKYAVSVQTVPAIADILSGKSSIGNIRDVELEDLLGRDPVVAKQELMHACISGKVVMVTGAGGSIGSELCRQIIQHSPSVLVLLELNEFSLYSIEQELQYEISRLKSSIRLVSRLGSVQKEHRMEALMRNYGVQTVYHAAAYKHVPLVEENVVEGVRNNVFGAWYAAEAAVRAGVESFVLISTDKAVRPTNVMGASKRVAELVLQGLAQRQSTTRFTMVRFGNVLGSSGSVVPLFRQQIKQGGPVTVTHPYIIRYFMTIHEASELVIQAGAMGRGGDVFVLDMGEPVKIVDLARRMIHLSGLEMKDDAHPNGDIAIEYTGLRPGEKLYEELLIGDNVTGTEHSRIMRAEEQSLSWEETKALLDELDRACHTYKCELVRELLLNAPTGYHSTEEANNSIDWLKEQENMKGKLRLIS